MATSKGQTTRQRPAARKGVANKDATGRLPIRRNSAPEPWAGYNDLNPWLTAGAALGSLN